jgi:hypothetical protein
MEGTRSHSIYAGTLEKRMCRRFDPELLIQSRWRRRIRNRRNSSSADTRHERLIFLKHFNCIFKRPIMDHPFPFRSR